MIDEQELRSQIIDFARMLEPSGLSVNRSGNISARWKDGFLITPTGMVYEQLEFTDVVFVAMDGALVPGQRAPSSEWRFHQAAYRDRPEIGSVVHCHSTHATALACTGRAIPAFHYMVAVAGGDSVACAPYATFGGEDLARNVAAALSGGRRACLLANHGQVACGADLDAAFALAKDVEELARQYIIALQIGGVTLLDSAEMSRVLDAFTHYGRQDEALD
jgi:L-fuculose-phosphate aldolase